MSAPTLKERYAAGLLAAGYTEVASRSSKFVVYRRQGAFIFLGKAGSVRFSRLSRVDSSVPVSDKGKAKILSWATEGYTPLKSSSISAPVSDDTHERVTR